MITNALETPAGGIDAAKVVCRQAVEVQTGIGLR